MAYPWPSFGSFTFKRSESALWGTDVGWALSPTIAQTRPIGSVKDHIVATAIGSRARSFEINLETDRQAQLESLINTTAVLTDWERPVPDSRPAFLVSVEPVDRFLHQASQSGQTTFARRFRVTFVSQ